EILLLGLLEIYPVLLREPADEGILDPGRRRSRRPVDHARHQPMRQQMLQPDRAHRVVSAERSPGAVAGLCRCQSRIFRKSAASVAGACGGLEIAMRSASGPIMYTVPLCTTLYCSPSCSCF